MQLRNASGKQRDVGGGPLPRRGSGKKSQHDGQVREAGHDLPVLIMGYVPRDSLEEIVARDLRPVVYNLDTLERLIREREVRRVVVGLPLSLYGEDMRA